MYKLVLIIFIALILSGCAKQYAVSPEKELTFEKKFEIKMNQCNTLKEKQETNDCKDDVILEQAISLDDISYCDYSSSIKATEFCKSLFYLDKAQKKEQDTFCNFITQETIKEICMSTSK